MASAGSFRQLSALYRHILRAHRKKLPGPLRALGDSYASEEFRRHLKAKTTRSQWQEFGQQWSSYVSMLNGTADLDQHSSSMPEDIHAALNAEQREQLSKLQQAVDELAHGGHSEGEGGLDNRPLG
eukprot:GHRQ01030380.1.p1 GENE.GHRQ01030380.1~~GHRQ01030380.1.p1  ORF type:complete len:126 (-),score=17.58 GHRQ01030380.1:40-417(-)